MQGFFNWFRDLVKFLKNHTRIVYASRKHQLFSTNLQIVENMSGKKTKIGVSQHPLNFVDIIQSARHSGHDLLMISHRWIQSSWNLCLHEFLHNHSVSFIFSRHMTQWSIALQNLVTLFISKQVPKLLCSWILYIYYFLWSLLACDFTILAYIFIIWCNDILF